MSDLATFRRNKIELIEYEYAKDVRNRVLMSQFMPLEIEVLEEILYSSLKTPISLLERNLNLSNEEILPILEKLSKTELFTLNATHVLVDKEMRKYYEFQILKFEDDFKPGMEYLQGLLRKVPIHVLPTWYSISRTSNNIFDSIVEKYLQTPQIFQRYLMDLNLTDPIQAGIMNEVYQSPDYEIEAADMMKKFALSPEQFEEHMLFLEFSFVACVSYIKEGDRFKGVITPFYEWQEYLLHVRKTDPSPIIDDDAIEKIRESDFAFIEAMSVLVALAQEGPVQLNETIVVKLQKKCPDLSRDNLEVLIERLCDLHFAEYDGETLCCNSDAAHWLNMDLSERALFLYRNPISCMKHQGLPEYLLNERVIREAEKSLVRIESSGWISLSEFLKGILIPLRENQEILLKRTGRTWKYELPEYSEEETKFFTSMLESWLHEAGITSIGDNEGCPCFCLTSLGQTLFCS
ncbi:MAG: hypothetical protein KR126chlam1_01491 [Chlamydiae bacterium]|nr:hypothetical protein [Chlamydiota bacterium]